MSRPLSPVTAAAFAAVLAMSTLVLWNGLARVHAAAECFGPACGGMDHQAPHAREPLGLIDL